MYIKKTIFLLSFLAMVLFVTGQHLETTIKLVGGKARIAVKAVGGAITGSPTGTTFCIRIPIANSAAVLDAPTIVDASRLPLQSSLQTGNYTDASYKYFILLWAGGTPSATFANDTEYDLVELNWSGPNQAFPVTLVCLANGNPTAPVLPFQWYNYLEVGGVQYSFGDVLFYQSGTSNAPTQMAADFSSGTAFVTTSGNVTLPVSLLNFSGYKSGSKNVLKWTTGSEQNNQGFEVQRSGDGVSYSAIGFVNSRGQNGNSITELNYSFEDNNPLGSKRSYYRLRQVDHDNRSKLSNVVLIAGDKPKVAGIGGVYPNPASQLVNVIVESPQREDVMLLVLDVSGKTVKQKLVNVETGSNTVPVPVSELASGSYLVKVISRLSEGESVTAKFVKQ